MISKSFLERLNRVREFLKKEEDMMRNELNALKLEALDMKREIDRLEETIIKSRMERIKSRKI